MARTEVFLVDDDLHLDWKIVSFEEVPFPDGILVLSTFPSNRESKKIVNSGNATYLIDEWFNEKYLQHHVRHGTPLSYVISDKSRHSFFVDISETLFNKDNYSTAWFKVFSTKGNYDLPFENSGTGVISFYNGKITGTVIQTISAKHSKHAEYKQKKRSKKSVFVLLKLVITQ